MRGIKLRQALAPLSPLHYAAVNGTRGGWAILLGRPRGCGVRVTVAGRPPEVAGIENMVGLFINTLSLRVQLPPGTPLLELLRQVQASQSRLMEHQHLPQAFCSEIPPSRSRS